MPHRVHDRFWVSCYDDFNRVTGSSCTAHCPNGTNTENFSYDYDRYGNRWHQNAPNGGPAPQMSFSGSNNRMDGYSYDAAGNLLSDGSHNYTYDPENRIIRVDGGSTATYTYDGDGRRVTKTTGGQTINYVYDLAGREIDQVLSSGGWLRGEVYAGGRHLATYVNSTTYFPLSDWLGTERTRTDVAGAACETIVSLVYGDGQVMSGSCGDPSPLHFTGKERDAETNLDDFGARYYSSQVGRFMIPDWAVKPAAVPYASFGDPQTLNLYTYVENAPLNRVDADGHYDAMSPTPVASGFQPFLLNAPGVCLTRQHCGEIGQSEAEEDEAEYDRRVQQNFATVAQAQNKKKDDPNNLQLVPKTDSGSDHQPYREIDYQLETKKGDAPNQNWYVTEQQTNTTLAPNGTSTGNKPNAFKDSIGGNGPADSQQTFWISTTKGKKEFQTFVHTGAGDYGVIAIHIQHSGNQPAKPTEGATTNGFFSWPGATIVHHDWPGPHP